MIRQIVVLAGGLATRLYPITKTVPKSMIPINGEPFIAHQFRLFKSQGIEDVVLCVGHMSDQIRDYIGNGKKFGLSVSYSEEKQKLDTGGAMKHATPYLDDIFYMTYGDSYLLQNYHDVENFYRSHNAEGLMCVYRNRIKREPNLVLVDGNYVKKYQKKPPPKWARYLEYGLNIFRKDLMTQVTDEVFPNSAYFDILIPKKQLLAFRVPERFYEIGSHAGIKELEALLRQEKS